MDPIWVSGRSGLPWIDPCVFTDRAACIHPGRDIVFFESLAHASGIRDIKYIEVKGNGSPYDNCTANTVFASIKCGRANASVSFQYPDHAEIPLLFDVSIPIKFDTASLFVPKIPSENGLKEISSLYEIFDVYTWILIIMSAAAYKYLSQTSRKLGLVVAPAFDNVGRALGAVRDGNAKVAMRGRTYELYKDKQKSAFARFGNTAEEHDNMVLTHGSNQAFHAAVDSTTEERTLTLAVGNKRNWIWAKLEDKRKIQPFFLTETPMFIVFAQKSHLKAKFDHALRNFDGIRGTGTYLQLQDYRFRRKKPVSVKSHYTLLPYETIHLHDVQILIILLAIGFAIPCTGLITELAYHKLSLHYRETESKQDDWLTIRF